MKCKAVIEFEIPDELATLRVALSALETQVGADKREFGVHSISLQHVKVLSIALGTQSVAQELPT